MTIETTGTAPLQPGQSRSFSAGPRHLLTVSRTDKGYVVTATRDGHDLPCYTSIFRIDNIPADMTPRVAAFIYMANLHSDFTTETPAPATPVAVVPEPAPLSEGEYQTLLAAHSNHGQIATRGCNPTDLAGLVARGHLARNGRRHDVTAAGREAVTAEYRARRTARTQTLAA